MSLILANGIQHHVAEVGHGPPLVLLHGLFVGSLAQWYFTAAPALASTHRVVMTDLRGHGRTERAASGYDLETLAADLHGVVEACGIDTPGLVGHSYGGLVALAYALRHPVRSLVLVDVPLPGTPRDPALASPEALLDAIPGPVRDVLLGGGRRARRLLEGLAFLARDSSLLADMEREPMLEGLGALEVPVHLIYGTESGCRDSRELLSRAIPHATAADLPGGHFLPVEAAEALTAELVRVLAPPAPRRAAHG